MVSGVKTLDCSIREQSSSINNVKANLDLNTLLIKAKSGDKDSRELIIEKFTPFILRVASGISGRYLRVGHDDEVSIGMIAFNEAIDSYQVEKGVAFLTFAETVIKRRLIDYFRKEGRYSKVIPFSSMERDEEQDENPTSKIEAEQAKVQYRAKAEAEERKDEIIKYSKILTQYGISFSELVELSPKHEDARLRAMGVAWIIAGNDRYREYLQTKKSLPLKKLESEVKVTRKTLERQRKYIIAVALILIGEFKYLKEYINISN